MNAARDEVMYTQQVAQSFKLLRENGIFITQGLTTAEIEAAEKRYNFKFPNDYKALLMQGMPLYDYDFTDWRNLSDEYVKYIQYKMFDETISGVLCCITKFDAWPEAWGNRPDNLEERLNFSREKIKKNPLFIPIKSNRYLALSPADSGNPVYSIHEGDDVICYGENLWDYFTKMYVSEDECDIHINLKTMPEPFPAYNTFVYHSINSFFYRNTRYYDESGRFIPDGEPFSPDNNI
ncbi:hypothetical protein A311_04354 [Escherichia coli KTE146]|nr:hypothetical protein A311_04354 [Escherichia coli KTE146]